MAVLKVKNIIYKELERKKKLKAVISFDSTLRFSLHIKISKRIVGLLAC